MYRKGYELVTYEANPYAREPPDAGLSPSSCQFYRFGVGLLYALGSY